jgi:hypothetical protein
MQHFRILEKEIERNYVMKCRLIFNILIAAVVTGSLQYDLVSSISYFISLSTAAACIHFSSCLLYDFSHAKYKFMAKYV